MPSAPEPAPISAAARGWRALFALDARSLAAFRIGLGLLLLLDLWGRAQTLREHYTGEGLYPRELALALVDPDLRLFHVFLWSDRIEVQAALFGVFALLAVLLVVGWHTRVVTVLAWVFLVSLVRRNHWACHTGDAWLEVLLGWGMFLPLGSHVSFDRLRGRVAPLATSAFSLATVGVLAQIGVFYFMAGALKARYEVWTRGEAVWIFTHVLEYTRPFGAWLGQFPAACAFLTRATLALEGLAPFLWFLPWRTAHVRALLFVVYAAFHLTLQATIHIGIFQLLCIVALTLFLPGAAWDALARALPAGVRTSWGRLATRVRARFGRATPRGRGAEPWTRAARLARNAVLVPILVLIVLSNANALVRDPYDRSDRGLVPLPRALEAYGRIVCVVQNWNMFTDIGRVFFGWFLVLGQTEAGEHVDVLAGTPAGALARPAHYARVFPNHNARRYWREAARPERADLQRALCDYLAREWQRAGRAPLTHLAVYHVGRVPLLRAPEDDVKPIALAWEAPHESLATAAPEVRTLWEERRARWRAFLERVPRTIPQR
jgi:hypothetical protein